VKQQLKEASECTYNSNSVIVDVCLFVQFLLELCVFLDGSVGCALASLHFHQSTVTYATRADILDSSRVEGRLVDSIDGDHVSERGRVIIGGAGCKNFGFGTKLAGIRIWRGGPFDGVPLVI
jgi:hypothetical protein